MVEDRTRIRRLPHRGVQDRAALDALLDEALVGHVGFDDDGPVVIPTAVARDGDRLLLHGSSGSRMMRRLADGAEVCVTVTQLDGLVLARAVANNSMNYRSAVVFGRARAIIDAEAKWDALRVLTERLLPGRWSESREPTRRELAATAVAALPLQEWSLKARAGGPNDDEEDLGLPIWAGHIPLTRGYAAPEAATQGLDQPPSVQRLLGVT